MAPAPPRPPPLVTAVLDWFTPPSLRGLGEARVQVLVAAYLVSGGFGLLFPAYRIHFGHANWLPFVPLLTMGVVGCLALLALWALPRQRLHVGMVYFASSCVLLPAHVAFGDGTGAFAMSAVAAVPICAMYVVGLEAGLLSAVLVTAMVTGLAVASVFGFRLPPVVVERDTVALAAFATLCSLWLPLLVAWAYEVGRRASIDALQRSEARATLAVEAAGGGVLEAAAGEVDWYASLRLRQLLGLESGGATFRPAELYACLIAEDGAALAKAIVRSLTERVALRVETRRIGAEPRWLAWEGLAEVDGAGNCRVVAIVRDITEERRLEHLKDDFVSTVSHELRTPLTSIHGAVALLSSGVGGTLAEPGVQLLEITRRGSERLLALVNDLLDLQRLDQGRVLVEAVETDVFTLATQVAIAAGPVAAGRGVQVRVVEGEPRAPTLRSDPRRVEQVIANLVSNACKFTAEGTEVEVRVLGIEGAARVEVTDHGPGIPTAFQPHLFVRFSQAWTARERGGTGTGLGLNIAKSLTERLGGRIGFVTSEGVGSTFWIELPTERG